ncbi:hypothetical protein [Pseudobdellovibrio exovorus]|uniref:OSBS enolase-like N-terminal domain-containing protein n=1 Tax=Pseudobdellovibrio exovorus JSS TaxID=1184267 RepID=M4V8L6_9BACT|nr:hypothetical protein [Pseudobdellovibrio exovorus]AGH94800.1 hypothetical protein A11Q_580 [Pseudobdellovibrio exovorus JSS]
MKLSCSSYRLKKRTALNALTQESYQDGYQEGALLRFVDGDDWGVADLCPKPEFGDSDWQTEIKQRGLLFLRATELAIEDLLARKNKKSLISDKKIPSNYLITDVFSTDLNQPQFVGKSVKIKCGSQVSELLARLNAVSLDVRLRLDFNNTLNAQQFEMFLKGLSSAAKNRIEYIEDPVAISEAWKDWNQAVPLAYDFQSLPYREDWATFLIIKPSRQSVPLSKAGTVILTSAMEHPVGFAHALRTAQSLAQRDSGFLTLDLYEDIGFGRYFVHDENLVGFSSEALSDYGIGMSQQLNQLTWVDV